MNVYVLTMFISWIHTGDIDEIVLNTYTDPVLCEAVRQQTLCRAPLDHPLLKKEKYQCKMGCFQEYHHTAETLNVFKSK